MIYFNIERDRYIFLFSAFIENMNTEIKLLPGRGTELRKNLNQSLTISVASPAPNKIRILVGDTFYPYSELTSKSNKIEIKNQENYWIINLSESEGYVILESDADLKYKVLYDPYLLEHADKRDFDAKEMQKKFGVPDGFIDTLPKWYSIKFTYPNYNLIFVRPGVGISVQTHTKRNEHWEIVSGNPYIIVGNKIHYDVASNTKFDIPIGTEHTIINPNKDEWVSLKETYTGIFDEKDIERVYNPNNYK